MNYGKLTAGTTKTAIDTAKPSEKGEIITYLSRMGDVLDDVPKRREVIVHRASRIHTVIDCNEANVQLRESDFRIHSNFQIVTTEPRHILNNDRADIPGLNIRKHFLKPRTVEICARVAVILIDFEIQNSVVACIFAENFNLVRNTVAVALVLIVTRKADIEGRPLFIQHFQKLGHHLHPAFRNELNTGVTEPASCSRTL